MNTSQTFKVKFHAEAAARIAELAKEVLSSVRSFGPIDPPPSAGAEIHPVAHIGPDEIIGEIKVRQSSFNGLGTEVGRYWISKGMRVGWEGREFEAIKDLAIRLGSLTSIKGRVSESFLLDEVFAWLSETLELERGDELADYITERCSTEIKDYEIWVPVFRTYSTTHFKIGNVDFRTVSKAILDRSYGQLPDDVAKRPEVAIKINRERSRIQGSIAACIRARAEFKKAREVAQSAASSCGLYLCRQRPEFTLSEVEGLPHTCGAGALAREKSPSAGDPTLETDLSGMFIRHRHETRQQLTLDSEMAGRGRPPHAFHVHQSTAADQIPLS